MCVCVCVRAHTYVCVCMCEREREKERAGVEGFGGEEAGLIWLVFTNYMQEG